VNHGEVSDLDIPVWELRRGTGFFGSKNVLVVRPASELQSGEQVACVSVFFTLFANIVPTTLVIHIPQSDIM
jgi:hypothetical protein